MKRITVLLIFVFLLMLPLPLHARDKGDLPGNEAPKYEALLDMEQWLERCEPEDIMYYLEIDLDRDMEKVLKAVEKACGYEKWKQTELMATNYKGDVYIKSVLEHKARRGDESFCTLITDWEPTEPELIKGFSRDNLLALYGLGNPEGLWDVMMEWFIETGSMGRIVDSLPLEEEKAFVKLALRHFQMTAKGYWYEAQEEYYPYLGDEIAVAFYANGDFEGWDDIWMADSLEEFLMARIIIAVKFDKPGLAVMLSKAVNDYLELFEIISGEFFFPFEDEEEGLKVQTMPFRSGVIYYVEFDEGLQIGWTEYGRALFISDLDTLLDLPEYFHLTLPNKMPFDRYNEYVYLDADGLADILYDPFAEYIDEELEWIIGMGEDAGLIEDMLSLLRSNELGDIEIYDVIDGDRAEITMRADRMSADLMLMGTYFLGFMLQDDYPMAYSIQQYLKFYGGRR